MTVLQIRRLKFKAELENGPVKKRHCTDIFWAIFFVLFCLGMWVTTGYGFWLGNPWNMAIGWDGDGNGCGYRGNQTTANFPYLYFPMMPNITTATSIQ